MCADAKKKPESASSPPTLPVDTARDDGSASVHTVQQIEELSERMAALTNTNRQLKRKIFDLYTIFEISRNFNSVLDYETLLDTFILTALAQVGASRAAIFLPLEQWPDRFVQAKARGSGEFADAGRFFKAGSGLLTYMTSLNRPLPTGELIDSHADRGEKDVLEHFHPGLVVPLMYQSNLTGIFIIADKMSNRKFEMDDIEFLSVLGSQISVAIENARLYSAEKMATRQLRAAQEQLVQTERAAALGEMSAKVAHEVNNPLGIIGNYLQLIRRVVGTNIEAINYVDIVSEEIDRIAGATKFNGIKLLDNSASVNIHFGKLITDNINVMGSNVTSASSGLNITGLTIADVASAKNALVTLDSAISSKDTARAAFGYKMNRLEGTISVLNIAAENLQASESRISDADIATEMAEMTRNQVLAQAGISMLSQANTMPQMALQLLR